jgi:DNA invertase Pin-like site-specific DNA recombinase
METLGDEGAKFQSLSEPWANTTIHAGKMIMTVFAGIAEFEKDLIRERTAARRQRRTRARRFIWATEKAKFDQVRVVHKLLEEGKSVREIAQIFKAHEATVYRNATQM